MSFEITTAFVQQYKDNVIRLAQQKGTRFERAVRVQPDIVGMNYYYERIGATAAQVKVSRHSPTPLISTPHSRRRVSMVTYNWGDLVDNDDKLKLLINPESEYVINAHNAFGRVKDDVIIAAFLGTSFAGSDGATSVTFPTGQIVADTSIANDSSLDVAANDGGHMSPQRMRAVKLLFDQADVDPDEERFFALPPTSIIAMLSHVQVTSADYNTVKALAEGALDTYMGFKPIMSNRIPLVGTATALGNIYTAANYTGSTTGDRMPMAWAMNGMGLAVQEEVKTEIAKRPDMNFATQIYIEMVIGSTRIEEARTVLAPTKDL